MQFLFSILFIGLIFGICFLVDKLFARCFRSRPQHVSGKSVRLNKRYFTFGILAFFFGAVLIVQGSREGPDWMVIVIGILAALLGLVLTLSYTFFGVFYDQDSFILSRLGRKSVSYRFSQIASQQLLESRAGLSVELFLQDGREISLQANMQGVYPFLDCAAAAWQKARGYSQPPAWFDPDNSCWFPPHDAEKEAKQ